VSYVTSHFSKSSSSSSSSSTSTSSSSHKYLCSHFFKFRCIHRRTVNFF
jgi:hypothetical protein